MDDRLDRLRDQLELILQESNAEERSVTLMRQALEADIALLYAYT